MMNNLSSSALSSVTTFTDLPRLAVVTDIPVERTHAGMLILYRLLADYPAGHLLVVNGPGRPVTDAGLRLPGVEYRYFSYPSAAPRWMSGRPATLWRVWADACMPCFGRRLAESLRDFRPQAVLTVADGLLWTAAAAAAAQLSIPLHLILHDDHPGKMTSHSTRPWAGLLRQAYRRTLARVYRQAASRLAVSPGMAELYESSFGPPAEILYPNRGDDSPAAKVRVRPLSRPAPVVVFTGSTNVGGADTLLRRLASLLDACGGQLHLYTNDTPSNLSKQGITHSSVRLQGFLPTVREMAERVSATAHALFLPASFGEDRRTEISTLFPSKLADYTAIGLPILIWGPDYSSAARWGRENPEAAVLVTDSGGKGVLEALARFAADPAWAADKAAGAVAAGMKCFDPAAARRQLYIALAKRSVSSI